MNCQQLVIRNRGVSLAGEWCLPSSAGPHPTVLMIHGSGPLDRNENTRGQSLNVFNTLAAQLAAESIASLRYDKRGCGKSGGDYYSAGHHDLVDDASACLDHLATVSECDPERIFLLGHSEGTIIAAQLAARHPYLAGLVLLCPFIESMESILRRQAEQMQNDLRSAGSFRRLLYSCFFAVFGDPVANQERLLKKLKASDSPTIRLMLQKVNAKWLRELIALDNEQIYADVRVPMLLIGGQKDIQCLPGDVVRIAAVAPTHTTQHVTADLTHILRCDPDDHTFLSYAKLLQQPIEPSIGRLTASWINGD